MSLVIDYEPDDLPDGYPDVWGELVESVRRFGVVGVFGGSGALGVSRRLPPDEAEERRREVQRAASNRFYARAKQNPAWLAERRAAKAAKREAERIRIAKRREAERRYRERAKHDPEWVAKRRAAARKWYAENKDKEPR